MGEIGWTTPVPRPGLTPFVNQHEMSDLREACPKGLLCFVVDPCGQGTGSVVGAQASAGACAGSSLAGPPSRGEQSQLRRGSAAALRRHTPSQYRPVQCQRAEKTTWPLGSLGSLVPWEKAELPVTRRRGWFEFENHRGHADGQETIARSTAARWQWSLSSVRAKRCVFVRTEQAVNSLEA